MSHQWDRVQKTLGQKGLEKLQTPRVGIVGLGSLGSQTALLLAMTGITKFALFDPDILEAHNVVRHAGDLRYVGQPKVEVVKDLILKRNPQADVQTFQGDARKETEGLANLELVLVAGLGSEIAQVDMGQILGSMKLQALYGGVYDRGVAGEVLFVDPRNTGGPCYSCFSSVLREEENPQIKSTVKVDYGLPPDEIKAAPGLGMHVVRISTVFADWALRILLNDSSILEAFPGNLVILSNEADVIGVGKRSKKPITLPPASSSWKTIKKQPGCLICGLTVTGQQGSVDDLLKD